MKEEGKTMGYEDVLPVVEKMQHPLGELHSLI